MDEDDTLQLVPVTVTVGSHEPHLIGWCWPDDDPVRIMAAVEDAVARVGDIENPDPLAPPYDEEADDGPR
jgi:hypothetical protein